MCVCVRESERERERDHSNMNAVLAMATSPSLSSHLAKAVECSKRSPELIYLLDMHTHFSGATPGKGVRSAVATLYSWEWLRVKTLVDFAVIRLLVTVS